jgi:hypothetical protein
MTTRRATRRTRKQTKSKAKRISLEIVICYVATLILAGYIAHSGLDSSAVWGFLGVALGLLFGKVAI